MASCIMQWITWITANELHCVPLANDHLSTTYLKNSRSYIVQTSACVGSVHKVVLYEKQSEKFTQMDKNSNS